MEIKTIIMASWLIIFLIFISALFRANVRKRSERAEQAEQAEQAKKFLAEYKAGNIHILLAAGKDGEEGFQVFSRIGENGTPRYEGKVAAADVPEALAAAVKMIGVEI